MRRKQEVFSSEKKNSLIVYQDYTDKIFNKKITPVFWKKRGSVSLL